MKFDKPICTSDPKPDRELILYLKIEQIHIHISLQCTNTIHIIFIKVTLYVCVAFKAKPLNLEKRYFDS